MSEERKKRDHGKHMRVVEEEDWNQSGWTVFRDISKGQGVNSGRD